MFELVLPPVFTGLSRNEYEEFRTLGWKTGKISDLPVDQNFTGILLSGTIKNEEEKIITPGRLVLGIMPFVKQLRVKYQSAMYHEIAYIETSAITDFFLKNPKALQSYLKFCDHLGYAVIDKWMVFPDVYGISSPEQSQDAVHLAFSLSRYFSNSGKRVALLDISKGGAGIFSALGKSPPPALVQKQKDDPQKIDDIIEKRKVFFNETITLINVTFSSAWWITKKQWGVLYRVLRTRYDTILLFFGSENPDYFYEETSALFVFSSDERNEIIYNQIREKNYALPTLFRIFPSTSRKSSDKCLKYPEYSGGILQKGSSTSVTSYEKVEQFIRKNFESILTQKSVNIFSDSFLNKEGMFATLELLAQKTFHDPQSRNVNEFLRSTVNFFHGFASFTASLFTQVRDYDEAVLLFKRIREKKLVEIFRPVYPEKGIFNPRPIHRNLYRLFSDIYQDQTGLFFSYFCSRTCTVHSVSSGILIDNLLQVMYPAGLLDSLSSREKKMQCVSENHWMQEIAWIFRSGFNHINIYYFTPNEKENVSTLVKSFYQKENQLQFLYSLAGKNIQIIVIPAGSGTDFSDNKAEIYHEMKSILNY